MKICSILILFLIYSTLLNSEVIQPDFLREKKISDQVLSEIFFGDLKYIAYNSSKFSVLEISNENIKKGILFLHGRGLNPNETNLAYPLRISLSEFGFNTYSIQLPVLKKGKTYNDYLKIFYDSTERIKRSLDYIAEYNDEIVIIAHSCGVHMLMNFLDKNKLEKVSKIILIGSDAIDKGQKLINEYPYSKINVPVMDIYGENDFDLVKKKARKRYKLIKEISDKSEQHMIINSDHYHTDNSDAVIEVLKKWLK